MNLAKMLTGAMTSQATLQLLAEKTGLSKKQISSLITLALPLLLKSMTGNASSPQGAASLLGALGQHSSKKSVTQQIEEADTKDGKKIVNHIFGENTSGTIDQLASQTGMSADQVTTILSHISPAMMSGVSSAASQAKEEPKKAAGIDLFSALFKN